MRLIDADKLETSLENSCNDDFSARCFVDFLAYMDEATTLDAIVFPQTIENITYNSAKELIEWIKEQQRIKE